MKQTDKVPDQDGYYWFRPKGYDIARVVLLAGGWVFEVGDAARKWAGDYGGDWCGPVPKADWVT